MPDYTVSFRRSAEKDLRRLDATVQRRAIRAIDGLAHEPRPPPEPRLMGDGLGGVNSMGWRAIFYPLVPKLQLGNALVPEAPLRRRAVAGRIRGPAETPFARS